MARSPKPPYRVHLLAHANPLELDLPRFGFETAHDYVAFVRKQLPEPLELVCDLDVLAATEEPWKGGRTDDALRIKDLQRAIRDKRTLALVAASGGAYFTRLLPHLDFSLLAKRSAPFWVLGFSEMSTLVNVVATYRCGRGLYWLCPNWVGKRIHPAEAARAALGEFWRALPDVLAGRIPDTVQHLHFGPIVGQLIQGRATSGRVRVIGGCLSVLANAVSGPLGRRARPVGKWLALEDIKESPYRIDRHLASLKCAGWFDRVAGILVGDFHMMHNDTQEALLELLPYHLPPRRRVPIVVSRSFGHVWPLAPLLLNRPLRLEKQGDAVTFAGSLSPGTREPGSKTARQRGDRRKPR